MAYGTVPQRLIQFGLEDSSAGSATAATAIWRGPGAQIDDGLVIVNPNENVGLIVDTDRTYVPFKMATLDFPECAATYEQMLYLLAAGVKNVTTGTSDGTGTGEIFDYPVSSTGANVCSTFTIEAGDNYAAAEMEYAFPLSFELTWAPKQALMVSSKWVGRQKTATSFTTLSLASFPVEEILAPKIYIDSTSVGDTLLSGTLIGYKLSYVTGLYPLATGDGQLYFNTKVPKKPTAVLSLTYEHATGMATEYAAYLAQTTRLVRILHEGSALTIGSGVYAKKTFRIDLAGRYTQFPPFTDQDGDNIVTCEITAGWNAAASLFCRFTDVCTLAAIQ
jgi:hypothetical protein